MSEHDEIRLALRRAVNMTECAGRLAFEYGSWDLASRIGDALHAVEAVSDDLNRLEAFRRERRAEIAGQQGGELCSTTRP